MVDGKVRTLLAVVQTGSYTKAAEELHLTQPAVSHHIRLLEQEFGIRIFNLEKRNLVPTAEGAVLIKYARRMMAVYNKALQAIVDSSKQLRHLTVGITQTIAEHRMPQAIALYCLEHPETHISIFTDTIKNLYTSLELYELDLAVVDGPLPASGLNSVLLDTDYLCLAVSPQHRFAGRPGVSLEEVKKEKLILRPTGAGTRIQFDSYLLNHSDSIRNFDVMMELDNLATIKELVSLNLGMTIVSRSACREDEKAGRLVVVPFEDARMTREVNLVYHRDFSHPDVPDDLRRIYNSLV